MITLSEKPLIRAYNVDCMEFMADKAEGAYELAIVDPPYGIGESNASFESRFCTSQKWKNARPTNVYKKKDWDSTSPVQGWFEQLSRISKAEIIFGGNYFPQFLKPSMGWVFWDKDTGDADFSDGELIYTSFDKATKLIKFVWSGFRKCEQVARIHPTQKPVALYLWLLTNYAKPGQTILDTHGGSFSSAIACWKAGYDMDICELDEEYFDSACERFGRETRQMRLFTPGVG
jgi:site-specific DNA-methyltransferase (adenine-specific)